jgi:hypothetical protein
MRMVKYSREDAMNEKHYDWMREPFLLSPFLLDETGIYKSEVLVSLYDRLKHEDLYADVFHDNPNMGFYGFMNFFNSPGVLLQIISHMENGVVVDIAAMSWIVGIEKYVNRIKSVASFVVFKDYQNPRLTNIMAKLTLGYWFNELKMDIIIGMTPSLNKLAVRFTKRIGFQELFRIPNYTSLRNQICDCVISMIDSPRYNEIYQGE